MERNTAFQALKPVHTQRASEAIYEQVRQLILNGDLKPGDRLPSERNMMDMMQRSRPTIREALRMLERDGFIKTIAGSQGAVIQKPSTRTVEQSFQALLMTSSITLEQLAEIRGVTEGATARWAAERRTEQDVAHLQELLAQQESVAEDYEAFIRLDPRFHTALGKAAKNDVCVIITRVISHLVEDTLDARMRAITEAERRAMCRKILGMHRAIVEAIIAGDADAADKAMHAHTKAYLEDVPPASLQK